MSSPQSSRRSLSLPPLTGRNAAPQTAHQAYSAYSDCYARPCAAPPRPLRRAPALLASSLSALHRQSGYAHFESPEMLALLVLLLPRYTMLVNSPPDRCPPRSGPLRLSRLELRHYGRRFLCAKSFQSRGSP